MDSKMPDLICRVCGRQGAHRTFSAREMMFGTRDTFTYFECAGCGTLQIVTIPPNLGSYYPQVYYSLSTPSGVKRWLQQRWAEVSYGGTSLIGSLIGRILGKHAGVEAVARAGVSKTSRILDVGCGSGSLLLMLEHLGFSHLRGVDPFLQGNLHHSESLQVYKGELSEVQGTFDLVMFNHSLEHVPDPQKTLKEALQLLAPDGILIIGIPVAGTFPARTYGANWVALDPPRHIFVPTLTGMKILSQTLGLTEKSIRFESDEFSFWGSEQYAKDIPLNDPRSHSAGWARRIFPSAALREYRRRAKELNAQRDSDAASFIYTKTP